MAPYSAIMTLSSCALVGVATWRRAFYTFWPFGSVGSIFLSASYCDNKKCFVIRDLIVLCDKPEWESAVRVWPLGGSGWSCHSVRRFPLRGNRRTLTHRFIYESKDTTLKSTVLILIKFKIKCIVANQSWNENLRSKIKFKSTFDFLHLRFKCQKYWNLSLL